MDARQNAGDPGAGGHAHWSDVLAAPGDRRYLRAERPGRSPEVREEQLVRLHKIEEAVVRVVVPARCVDVEGHGDVVGSLEPDGSEVVVGGAFTTRHPAIVLEHESIRNRVLLLLRFP